MKLTSEAQEVVDAFFTKSFSTGLALGVIDFNQNAFDTLEWTKDESWRQTQNHHYFDLSSLTKPLTLSAAYLISPELFDEKLKLLLNHQGGLPSWSVLSNTTWKNDVLAYEVNKSQTLYSDLSAQRLQLELEKKDPELIQAKVKRHYCEIVHWLKMSEELYQPVPQYKRGKLYKSPPIVHDPKAYNIKEFMCHSGLWGTVCGICQTLLNLNSSYDLLAVVVKELSQEHDRFVLGWDTPSGENSLSGSNSHDIFGHLGFTGTSLWINSQMKKGMVILSNEVMGGWLQKQFINDLRRKLGKLFWQNTLFH